MHGYEIIQEIAERSAGAWKPSPGSVYPTLQLLADEGLITSAESGGKRLFTLTESGRAEADAGPDAPWEEASRGIDFEAHPFARLRQRAHREVVLLARAERDQVLAQ